MSLHLFRFRTAGILALAAVATALNAANAVPDAAMVSPAPLLDRPLDPAARESAGEAPSAQHAWVPGHWRWLDGAYVWEAGRWELPPAANLSWSAPQWQRQGNGYVLKEGFWSDAPPPAPVAAPMASAAQPEIVYVTQAPPPPQREVIYERPSAVHVWIGGYWAWRGGRHVWIAGGWQRPPRNNVAWVSPRWEDRGGRYVFVEGFWREVGGSFKVSEPPVVVAAPGPREVIVVAAPPPPREEIVYVRPSSAHVWIAGYWAWHAGRHVWIAGHWEMPPRGRHAWVEPRWERRGGNYIFFEGRWR